MRASVGLRRAKGPAHTSVGQRPDNAPGQGPQKNPKRQRRGAISEIIERRLLVPQRASKSFSRVSKNNTGCCRQGMGPNSTRVMPEIELERAFSALAAPVRFPSPLGWAGMMGAFGAPRFAGAVAMALDANPKCPNSRGRMQYPFSASHRPGVGTDAAVSQSRQRLECGDLSPLSSASASQLAADSPVRRAKAPTSWRTPNAAATAKPVLSLHTCRVRKALNTYRIQIRPHV